jgi:hypothetical protein
MFCAYLSLIIIDIKKKSCRQRKTTSHQFENRIKEESAKDHEAGIEFKHRHNY